MTALVRTVLLVLAAYLALGSLFAVAFHGRGLRRLDAATQGAGIVFRLLITPGIIALWPLLAARWFRPPNPGRLAAGGALASPRRLRATHAFAWKAMALLVPVAIAAALWNRPAELHDPPLKLPVPARSAPTVLH